MRRILLTLSLFLNLLMLSPVEGAQDNIFLDITNISSAKDGSVSMTISALDEKGVPIRGIEKEALSLYVDSKGVDSFSVEPVSDSPLSVMMFLDISGSMEGQSIFDAKRGISYLLNRLGANDFVSLVTFGDDVKGVVPFTQKKDVIESGLDSVKAGDKKTKLYQALSYALYLASRSYYTSRNVIVMFTDGKDEGSTVTSEELISSIKTVNIPVYVFGFGDEVAKEFLKKVAYTSHGGLFLSPSYDDFTKVGDTVLEQKRGKFNVVFDLKLPTDKYVATVKLGYNGKEAKAVREFVHIYGDSRAVEIKEVSSIGKLESLRDLYKQAPVVLWLIIFIAVIVILLILLLYIRQKRTLFKKLDDGFNNINVKIYEIKDNLPNTLLEHLRTSLNNKMIELESLVRQNTNVVESVKLITNEWFNTFSELLRVTFATYVEERMEQQLGYINSDMQALNDKVLNHTIKRIGHIEELIGKNTELVAVETKKMYSSVVDIMRSIFAEYIENRMQNGLDSLNKDMKVLKEKVVDSFIERLNPSLETFTARIGMEIEGVNKQQMLMFKSMTSNGAIEILQKKIEYASNDIKNNISYLSTDVQGLKLTAQDITFETKRVFNLLTDAIRSMFLEYMERFIKPIEIYMEGINKQIVVLNESVNSNSLERISSVRDSSMGIDSIANKIDYIEAFVLKNNEALKVDTERILYTFLDTLKTTLFDHIENRIQYSISSSNRDVHGVKDRVTEGFLDQVNISFKKSEQMLERAIDDINKQLQLLKIAPSEDSLSNIINTSIKYIIERIEYRIQGINNEIIQIRNDNGVKYSIAEIHTYMEQNKKEFQVFLGYINDIKENIERILKENNAVLFTISDTLKGIQKTMEETNATQNNLVNMFTEETSLLKEGMMDIVKFLVVLSKKE